MSPTAPPSRRDRQRAATVEEIKETALRLMRDSATTEVRFADIAREMGMTAPALYRYFPERDALLTALIVDAWTDLADTLDRAGEDADADHLYAGLSAVAAAYRAWALRDVPRFTLAFGLPIPGYVMPETAGTAETGRRSRAALERLIQLAIASGQARLPATGEVDQRLQAPLDHLGQLANPPLSPVAYQGLLQAWISVHGFVTLEAYGHLEDLTEPGRDALFDSQVRLAMRAMGLCER